MRRKSNASKTGGRGSARMKEFGYRQVCIWLDANESHLIQKAAERAGMKLASWIRATAFAAAAVAAGGQRAADETTEGGE